MPYSVRPYGLQPASLRCPWNSPDKNTEVGCPSLLQEIFLTQGLSPGLLHGRQVLYYLSHREAPDLLMRVHKAEMPHVGPPSRKLSALAGLKMATFICAFIWPFLGVYTCRESEKENYKACSCQVRPYPDDLV